MPFPFIHSGGVADLFLPLALANMVLHVLVAIGIYNDASDRAATHRKLWFIGAQTWTLATLLGGITTAAVYWLLHHSMLARPETSSLDGE